MFSAQEQRLRAVKKELRAAERQEQRFETAAKKAVPAGWRVELEKKIPEKIYAGLESAFCKGFSLVFQQGAGIIEKSFRKEALMADHDIRDYAVQRKGGRKALRQMHKSARHSDLRNLAVTAAEGMGLGGLGGGMPDIVLFLGFLLKGVYETAVHYGFGYESREEQYLILKMLENSLSTGPVWTSLNREVDHLLEVLPAVTDEEFQAQIRAAGSAFAVDMLLLKFIQGFPIIGVLGGAANPVYYRKVMRYVELKYREGYLRRQIKGKN